METENKDLCQTCIHYWKDFPLPLDRVVYHCEILDEKKWPTIVDMEDEISYPCLECPFNSYVKK